MLSGSGLILSQSTGNQLRGKDNGSSIGKASGQTSLQTSDFGTAILLDGSSFIEIPNPDLPTGNLNRTLEAWFKTSESNFNGVIANFGNVSYGQRFGIMVVNGNAYFVGQFLDIYSAIFVADGNWHHLAATYEDTLVKLYVDGSLAGSAVYSLNTSTDGLRVGRRSTGDSGVEGFIGSIDEVRIWNYARTQSQIADNQFTELSGSEEGLVALYHFNEGEGTTLYDATENANNGSFIGNTTFASSSGIMESLPVELSVFTGKISGEVVVLNWSTVSEKNNSGWEIESQSLESNGQITDNKWNKIGFVAGKGTTNEIQFYSFSVPAIQQSLLFRLKQIDLNGTVSYSPILAVEGKPSEFKLNQNYPNPFNPSTSISFHLTVKSRVTLTVFDMLGKEVETLIDNDLEAGSYSQVFDAKGLSSGRYYYSLSVQGKTVTNSMLLMK